MNIVSESWTMVSTAFGLVAALAWNEAIKKLIEEFIPKGEESPFAFCLRFVRDSYGRPGDLEASQA